MNSWHLVRQPLPSVCEEVNVTSVAKCFDWSVDWKRAIDIQVHVPYTSRHLVEEGGLY